MFSFSSLLAVFFFDWLDFFFYSCSFSFGVDQYLYWCMVQGRDTTEVAKVVQHNYRMANQYVQSLSSAKEIPGDGLLLQQSRTGP